MIQEWWIVAKKILGLAFPSILGFMALVLFETANIFWIGHLSSEAVAAVGAASFFEWMLFALMNLTVVGCSSLVSQNLGANRPEKTQVIIRDAWQLSMILSALFMLFLLITSSSLFSWMELNEATHKMAVDYFFVFILGLPIFYTLHLQTHIFNAFKDSKTSTLVMGFTVAFNILIDPFLILGWMGFPKLGIIGAPIATLLSQFLGVVIRLYILRRKKYIQPLKTFLTFDGSLFSELLKIGIPSATTNFIWTMVFPFLAKVIAPFGMSSLAGLNIGNRLESFPYYFALGLGWAVGVHIGHSYGAGNKKEVIRLAIIGLVMVTLGLLPISFCFVFLPESLASLLNHDPEVISHAGCYLRTVGLFEIFLGWEMLFEGAFNGLGHTKPYMWIRVPLTLVRIPTAYLLAVTLGYGVAGVWWAVTLSTLFKGLFSCISFFTIGRKRVEALS